MNSNQNELHSGNAFKLVKENNYAILFLDLQDERVNKFDEAILRELIEVCELLKKKQKEVQALLIKSEKKGSFIVGADVNIIFKLEKEALAFKASELGQKAFNAIEDLPMPTIAAIEGACMGGGTELALACNYRICSDHSKTIIALPEVKLGVLPGWGGCYRLPRLIGLQNALDIILSGKNIRPQKAERMGLVHKCVPTALFQQMGIRYVQDLASGKKLPFKERKIPLSEKALTQNPLGRFVFFKKAKEMLLKQSRGHYPAPLTALELIQTKSSLKRDDFLAEEARAFAKMAITPVCKNLIRLFFLIESNKKDYGIENWTPKKAKELAPIRQCAVLGAGVMGGGIAYQAALRGFSVFLKDIQFEAVRKGLAHAKKLFNKGLKRRRLKKHEAEYKMNQISGQINYEGFQACDLVVEAVVENLNIKNSVFKELSEIVPENCIIATNTSSLELTAMQSSVKNPERFVGMHFFNPVEKMPLVEIIRSEKSSEENIIRTVQFVKDIGKTALVVKDGPGFLVNRILIPWLGEVWNCLDEGCSVEKADKLTKAFGMPMGPFELMDEVGLDVVNKISPIFHESLGERFKPNPIMKKVIEENSQNPQKRWGKKTSLGFYKWKNGRRVEFDREGIEKCLGKKTDRSEFDMTDEDFLKRTLYPMINEAAVVLEEKIANSAQDIDLGTIFGIGFPPFRGGLCRYADSVGLKEIVSSLEHFSKVYGSRLAPTEALKKLATEQGSFHNT